MSTATRIPLVVDPSDQSVVLSGVGWRGYRTILRVRGGSSTPRVTYLDGDVILMSPSFHHEKLSERLGIFVIAVTGELDIECGVAGQTTLRRRKKRGGVEADKSYYIANFDRVRGKTAIDMRVDPPPDLAIEAVYSHSAKEAIEVYRRLGVAEVWVCDETGLGILALQPDGRYVAATQSVAFPYLSADEIHAQITRDQDVAESRWSKGVRHWAREVLVPRRG